MKVLLKRMTCFFLMTFSFTAFSWNAVGHMLVANIAYKQLDPDVRKKIDDLMDRFHQEYPYINSFSDAACWPDRLREQKITSYVHWHYIDMPFSQDGTPLKNTIDSDNAVWAIEKIAPIVKNNKANVFERARFIAFFAHIVGDLHQPLHTVSLFSASTPLGDKGGNLFPVRYAMKRSNLHRVWDMGVGAFDSSHLLRLDDLTAKLIKQYPKAYFGEQVANLDANSWVQEGMSIARQYAYNTQAEAALTPAYIDAGKQIAEQRVVLAGYRLAMLLNQLLA